MSAIDVVLVSNDPDMGPVRELNGKMLGVGGRGIPFIEQIDVCWKSLFQNWDHDKLPFTAWHLHTEPLGQRLLAVLAPYREQGLRVLQVPPVDYHPLGPKYNRGVALLCEQLQSPHRLVIDADVIFLGTPPLDLSAPVAAMWCGPGKGEVNGPIWRDMHAAAEVDYLIDDYTFDYRDVPHVLYHQGDDRRTFSTMFNMGTLMVRRDLAKTLFITWVPIIHKLYANLPGSRWLFTQQAMSLAIRKLTPHWQVLPRGVNFLPIFLPTKEAVKAGVNITLYHYAGVNGRGLEKEVYGEWFDPVPHYVRPDELTRGPLKSGV